MNYKSPIDLIAGQIETEMENEIVRVVQRAGINIDKNELMRALAYDRNQYSKGYHDRDSEIVRCRDCKHAVLTSKGEAKYCRFWQEDEDGNFGGDPLYLDGDFFCAGSERR